MFLEPFLRSGTPLNGTIGLTSDGFVTMTDGLTNDGSINRTIRWIYW